MKSYKSITVLAVSLTVLVGYNFMSAAWTAPAGSPPNNNTEAPVNVGVTTQTKGGILGSNEYRTNRYCDAAGANCFNPVEVGDLDSSLFLKTSSSTQTKTGVLGLYGLLVEGNTTMAGTGPRLKFDDTDKGAIDYWAHVNNNFFYILTDRNNDASWEDPKPMVLHTGSGGTQDYALFSDQVRANSYCNRNGANCFTSTYKKDVMKSSMMGWNGQGIYDYPILTHATLSMYPICFLTTQKTVARGDSDLTGTGGCTLTNDGKDWTLEAYADKRVDTLCAASCMAGTGKDNVRECIVKISYNMDDGKGPYSGIEYGSTEVTFTEGEKMSIGTYIGTQDYDTQYFTQRFQDYTWDDGTFTDDYRISNGYSSPEKYAQNKAFIDSTIGAGNKGMVSSVLEIKTGGFVAVAERTRDGRTTEMNAKVISCQ